jgi:hypothetical protein
MLVGSFLIVNLCVGVIIDNFGEMKKNQDPDDARSLFVTPAQHKYMEAQKKLASKKMFLALKDLETYTIERKKMFFFVNDDRFEGFIMG